MGAVEIRTLTPSEWEILRAVRLASLRDAPDAFTSTVEREHPYGPDVWQLRTASSAVAFVDGAPVGLAGWVRFDGADHMELVGMWVGPEHRGTGVAQALVDHVVAATAGEQLMLGVVATNDRARAFYRRAGFVPAGSEPEIGTERLLLRMRHDPPAARLPAS